MKISKDFLNVWRLFHAHETFDVTHVRNISITLNMLHRYNSTDTLKSTQQIASINVNIWWNVHIIACMTTTSSPHVRCTKQIEITLYDFFRLNFLNIQHWDPQNSNSKCSSTHNGISVKRDTSPCLISWSNVCTPSLAWLISKHEAMFTPDIGAKS